MLQLPDDLSGQAHSRHRVADGQGTRFNGLLDVLRARNFPNDAVEFGHFGGFERHGQAERSFDFGFVLFALFRRIGEHEQELRIERAPRSARFQRKHLHGGIEIDVFQAQARIARG